MDGESDAVVEVHWSNASSATASISALIIIFYSFFILYRGILHFEDNDYLGVLMGGLAKQVIPPKHQVCIAILIFNILVQSIDFTKLIIILIFESIFDR